MSIIYNHLAAVAQLVEQRTENPCVVGSIPTGGKAQTRNGLGFFLFPWIFTVSLFPTPRNYGEKHVIFVFSLVLKLFMAYNGMYEMVNRCLWW